MNSKDTSNEDFLENLEVDEKTPSVDDFIKELEAKEKYLDISADLVIEVGDSDVEHDNIHDSFVSQNLSKNDSFENLSDDDFASLLSGNRVNKDNGVALQEQVTKLTNENNELKESLKRRQRDFDNYRGRVERERNETFKNILSSLAAQILPVLDNMNRALDSATEVEKNSGQKDFQTFLEGIVLVNQQLNEVFVEMGVQPIPAIGKPFDPKIHEAVANVETDEYPHETVVEELLRGYRIDERIIRASMVKVSSAKNSQSPPELELE